MKQLLHSFSLFFVLCLSLVFVSACEHLGFCPEDEKENAVVTINICSPVTRSDGLSSHQITDPDMDDDGSPDDGDVFTSLRLWLVKNDNTKVYAVKFDFTEPYATSQSCNIICQAGTYTLYIVGNFTGFDHDYLPTGMIQAEVTSSDIVPDNNFKNYQFSDVAPGNSPAYSTAGVIYKGLTEEQKSAALFRDDNGGMPLSYVGEVTVVAGTNTVSAAMKRVCARVSCILRNDAYGKTVAINHLTPCQFNASTSFLFPRSDSDGNNILPPGTVTTQAFPSIDKSNFVVLEYGEQLMISDLYMFESGTELKHGHISGALYEYDENNPPYLTDIDQIDYLVGDNTRNISSGKKYFIHSSAASTYYFGMNSDGSFRLNSFLSRDNLLYSPEIEYFIWNVQAVSGAYTFYNEKTGRYLSLGQDGLASSTDPVAISYNETKGHIFADGSYLYSYANSPTVKNTSADDDSEEIQWDFREAQRDPKQLDLYAFDNRKISDFTFQYSLFYLNRYGLPTDLRQLKRNESLVQTISVKYAEKQGEIDFKIKTETADSDWISRNKETTFD